MTQISDHNLIKQISYQLNKITSDHDINIRDRMTLKKSINHSFLVLRTSSYSSLKDLW